MLKEIFKFGKSSVIYSVGNWVNIFFGFVVTYILTRMFSKAEYGAYEMMRTVIGAMTMLVPLGIDSAITRFYSEHTERKLKSGVFVTGISFKLVSFAVVVSVLFMFKDFFVRLIFKGAEYGEIFFWGVLSGFALSVYNSFLNLLRLKFKATRHFVLDSLRGALYFLLLVLMLSYSHKIHFAFEASFVVFVALIFFMLYDNRDIFDFSRGKPLLGKMLGFSLPLVPSAIAYYSMGYMDRYFLLKFADLESIALYSIAFRVASIVQLISSGFISAWPPFVYKKAEENEEESKKIFNGIFLIFGIILLFVGIFISIFSPELVTLLATEKYIKASVVVPVMVYYTIFYIITGYFCVGIGIKKVTRYRMYAGLIASAANFVLNFLLVPKFGIIGASVATFVSYGVYGVLVMYWSEKVFPVRYDYNIMVFLFMLGIVVSFVGFYFGGILERIVLILLYYIAGAFAILKFKLRWI